MNCRKALVLTLAASSLFVHSLAHAGPPVTITFKNLGNQPARYQNSGNTQFQRTPRPTVETTQSDQYVVFNPALPDITTASMRYTIGNKTCDFRTSYIKTIAPGGLFGGKLNYMPKWDKKAIGSGGANCTATVTSTNFSDHSWHVVFTMK